MKPTWKRLSYAICIVTLGWAITSQVRMRGDIRRLREAARLVEVRAGSGDAKAQYELGRLYYAGTGVPRDLTDAARWCHRSADQGYAAAESYLGFMYEQGAGVAQDDAEAVRWYRKAADQGDADAEYNLGSLYREGQGVPRDYAEAVHWYSKAAGQNDPNGDYGLGVMFYSGLGVPQDRVEAEKEFRKAAERGSARAQYNLANMYYRGEGVPQNRAEAYNWFRKAAEQGDQRSRNILGLGLMNHWAGIKVTSTVVFLGCLAFLISSLLADGTAKTTNGRLRVLAGLAGLLYSVLSLYWRSRYGIAESVEAANAIALAEGFLFGTFLALMLSVFLPKIDKTMVLFSGISLLLFNYFAITHYNLQDSFSATHSYYLVNGTLVGVVIFLSIATRSRRRTI